MSDARAARALFADHGAACICRSPKRPFYPTHRHRDGIVIHLLSCQRCDGYVGIEPAAPAPWEEIEAARIIAESETGDCFAFWQVAIGIADHDADRDPPAGELAFMWHAGWLARHIFVEHSNG